MTYLSNIPKTLTVALIDSKDFIDFGKKEGFVPSSNEGKTLVEIKPVPSKFQLKNVRLRHEQYRLGSNYSNSNEKKLKVFNKVVNNSGFKLRLNMTSYVYRYYNYMVRLEILHPDFDKLSYQPFIDIPYSYFLECLKQCDGVLGKYCELPGTWKIEIIKTGEYPYYNFYLEGEENISYFRSLSIEYGKRLEEIGKTSKWIPGHMYVNNSKEVFIYLGDVLNACIARRSNYRTEIRHVFEVTGSIQAEIYKDTGKYNQSYYKYPTPTKLVMRMNEENLNIYLSLFKQKTVSFNDIISILYRNSVNFFGSYCSDLCYTDFITVSSTPCYAVDMGECFKIIDIDETNNVTNKFIDSIANIPINELKDDDVKLKLIDFLISNGREYTALSRLGEDRTLIFNSISRLLGYFVSIFIENAGTTKVDGKYILDYLKKNNFVKPGTPPDGSGDYKTVVFNKESLVIKNLLEKSSSMWFGKISEDEVIGILNKSIKS